MKNIQYVALVVVRDVMILEEKCYVLRISSARAAVSAKRAIIAMKMVCKMNKISILFIKCNNLLIDR